MGEDSEIVETSCRSRRVAFPCIPSRDWSSDSFNVHSLFQQTVHYSDRLFISATRTLTSSTGEWSGSFGLSLGTSPFSFSTFIAHNTEL